MLLKIYSENPNSQEIDKVVQLLEEGKIIIYPTDSAYAIGCNALNKKAVEKVYKLKNINPLKANFSIICYDLAQVGEYTRMSNETFQLLKKNLPGPFTFILPTRNTLPQIFKKRKTVGIRICDNLIVKEIIRNLSNPILTTTLPIIMEEDEYKTDPELIHEIWGNKVDLVIDDGIGQFNFSTVVDCTETPISIIREGLGKLKE